VAKRIDLTVVGPEAPLAAGLTDLLAKEASSSAARTRAGAQMEGSKVFMKTILRKYASRQPPSRCSTSTTRRSSTC